MSKGSFSVQKDTKIGILFLVGAVLLSTASFLSYYLIEPKNWTLISILCAIDFFYLFLNNYWVLGVQNYERRTLKAIGASFGYIAVFNLIPVFLFFEGMEMAKVINIWKTVLVYSFFTGPCLMIIVCLVFLVMLLYDYANGHVHDRRR